VRPVSKPGRHRLAGGAPASLAAASVLAALGVLLAAAVIPQLAVKFEIFVRAQGGAERGFPFRVIGEPDGTEADHLPGCIGDLDAQRCDKGHVLSVLEPAVHDRDDERRWRLDIMRALGDERLLPVAELAFEPGATEAGAHGRRILELVWVLKVVVRPGCADRYPGRGDHSAAARIQGHVGARVISYVVKAEGQSLSVRELTGLRVVRLDSSGLTAGKAAGSGPPAGLREGTACALGSLSGPSSVGARAASRRSCKAR
jgi:hypothetical protein